MNTQEVMSLIQDCFNVLEETGTIESKISVEGETVLLGNGAQLESIAFVTFVTEFEDRLQEETGEEHFLVLDEVNSFNVNNPSLKAKTLAEYTVRLISQNE